jgi:hypothetical protein
MSADPTAFSNMSFFIPLIGGAGKSDLARVEFDCRLPRGAPVDIANCSPIRIATPPPITNGAV